jgi:hypothetical protein
VRLALDAPDQVRILRAELAGWRDDPLDAGLDGKRDWSGVAENDLQVAQARR